MLTTETAMTLIHFSKLSYTIKTMSTFWLQNPQEVNAENPWL